MARVLIVPCGCRGRELAAALVADGHAVRGTTRDPARTGPIAAAGAEPYLGDPDRIGTLMEALVGVTVVVWLAGSIAIPASRVRMLFEKLVDTPVRGVVYEGASPEIALDARQRWQMPVELLAPGGNAKAAVDRLLGI